MGDILFGHSLKTEDKPGSLKMRLSWKEEKMTKKETTKLTEELKWRLANKPTLQDVEKMLELELITKDEARTILFSTQNKDEKIKALEEQIDFLKDVIKRVGSQPVQTIIKYVHDWEPHYYKTPYWMSVSTNTINGFTSGSLTSTAGTSNLYNAKHLANFVETSLKSAGSITASNDTHIEL